MKITNQEITHIFEDVSDMLQIKGENVHRVLAYRNAAEAIRNYPRDLNTVYEAGEDLTAIHGIGPTLAEKIEEMLTTGKLDFYERLKQEIPRGLLDVLRINGVGPKKAQLFWKELGITSLTDLEKAAREGKLRNLAGMGKKSEQKIIDGIESLARQTDRVPIGVARPAALGILADLLALPGALKGDVAGSLRRFRPTIGDVDILIASRDPQPIMDRFAAREDVARVLGKGLTKTSVELLQGLQIDVTVLPPEQYGTGLVYFTGSQAHNIRLRGLAQERGWTLNEHAFTSLADPDEKILCETEEQVYDVLGLPWIPPEIREDRGEIEAAQAGRLPDLIEKDDILSDLHMHTTWSDGKLSIREMAEVARERGLKLIVITDHSRSLGIANGLSIERLMEQQAEIRRVNDEIDGITILHGTEMEIKSDGTLDFPDDVLAQLDLVVASLHTSLRQPKEQITERLLNAIRNPHVDIIGHPRGQIIGSREPADLDMEAVFAAARQHDVALEINANPARLDLEAHFARRAAELGVKISINTDAHSAGDFQVLPYGIGTARRGWLSAEDVINTWQPERLIEWAQARGKA